MISCKQLVKDVPIVPAFGYRQNDIHKTKRNEMLRSNVLALDRLVYPNLDLSQKEGKMVALVPAFNAQAQLRYLGVFE